MGILRRSKRGDVVTDPIIIFVLLILMGVSVFIGLRIVNGYSNSIASSEDDANSTFVNITTTVQQGAGDGVNNGVLFAVGLIFVIALVLASQLAVDPKWIWLGIVFGLVVVWGLWQARDTFSNAIPSSQFVQERAQAPQAANFLDHIGVYMVLFFILIFAVVYSRSGQGGVQ